MDNQTVMENDLVSLNENGYELDGYRFIGWNTEADGSGTSYLDQDEMSISKDITLYAQWVKTYT